MKLKYYMRGLGIGIVLTTLILTIAGTDEALSDQEIMKRAAELGMEMKDDKDENLDQVLKDMELNKEPQKSPTELTPSPAPTESPSVTPTESPTEPSPSPAPTESPSVTPTEKPAPTITPTPEPTSEPDNTPTEAPKINEESNGAAEGKEKITFTVKKGMSSLEVAKVLLKKGLIEDAYDFNRYIVKAKKASIIRIGTYTLPEGSSYDEIIKAITEK